MQLVLVLLHHSMALHQKLLKERLRDVGKNVSAEYDLRTKKQMQVFCEIQF